jgi:AmmeMemoRadiSam system protein B
MDALCAFPDTLLVVSSDLSHFLPYEQAKRVDAQTCERIIAKESALTGEEACGAHAINGMLSTALCRPLTVELLDLRNSGDTAGSRERVVGYGAFIVH